MMDSQDLLAEYRQNGSDAAFRELVARFVDLVHSTALRVVEGDTHRAEDVTQTVFVDLARLARTLSHEVRLGGWLHRHTCFVAANTLRGERRRQARERQAVEMNALQNHSEADFSQVAPLLDEAINELGEADRTAILLRFFEQQDFRSVGQALGSNEDAARMRVTRALEKLEEFLKRRGVTTSAASLGVVLTANAVQAAPVGLAVTISTAAVLAGTTLAATTTATAIKTIAMTTLQKTLITAALAAAVGTGIYEARQASNLRNEVQTLHQQQAPLTEQIRQLTRDRDEATRQLSALRDDNERLNRNTAELLKLRGEVTRLRSEAQASTQIIAAEYSAKSLVDKVSKLKNRLEETPNAKIPELRFLAEPDWLNVASNKLNTDADYRRALASLRSIAKKKFGEMYQQALKKYSQADNRQVLTDLGQLQPYFDPPVDDAILQRWQIEPAKNVSIPALGGDWVITEKAAVDDVFDTRHTFGLNGFADTGFLDWNIGQTLSPVWHAFQAVNNGQEVKDFSQLMPYATTPEQQDAIQKMILRASAFK